MAASSDPEVRSRAARIAALTRHALGDAAEATQPARAGFISKFEREVDPEGILLPEERARRADRAMRAHMLRLAARSAAARKGGGRRATR